MATAHHTRTQQKKTTHKTTASRPVHDEATALLIKDHEAVKKLFRKFKRIKTSGTADEKQAIVLEACAALKVHTEVEEKLFYPAARKVLRKEDLIDEAYVEHASCKALIQQLEKARPGDEFYDAQFTVLSEFVEHHVEEEENELFPKVRKSSLDLGKLGQQMLEMKNALEQEANSKTAH